MKLSELIALKRLQSKMSLQELADTCGCSKGHLHDIEHGKNPNITMRIAVRLSAALGISMNAMACAFIRESE
jgi:transcriptional regulator with XRE-family HTH domain